MNHGCWLGTYERENQELLARLLREGDVFLDLGANTGFFTLLAACAVGSHGTVIAIEPLPRNVALLQRHLALNRIANVRVLCAAVADRSSWVSFASGDTVSSGKIGDGGSLLVRSDTVDALCGSLDVKPNLVKMDIEGAEGAALQGMRELLSKARPVLQLSCHGDGPYRESTTFLQSFDYRCFDAPRELLHPTFGVIRERLCIPAEREQEIRKTAGLWLEGESSQEWKRSR